jgi:hypothetical protein
MKKKPILKPIDILLKICLQRLLIEYDDSSYQLYKDIEAQIKDPNTRYRAKLRIKKLIKQVKEEDSETQKREKYWASLEKKKLENQY